MMDRVLKLEQSKSFGPEVAFAWHLVMAMDKTTRQKAGVT